MREKSKIFFLYFLKTAKTMGDKAKGGNKRKNPGVPTREAAAPTRLAQKILSRNTIWEKVGK